MLDFSKKKIELPIRNQIHLWYVSFNLTVNEIIYLTNLLSKDETLRASKFKFKKNRNQFIVSRGILRLLSGKYLKIKPESITFKYGEFGKPNFDFDTNLKFNISHSGEIAILSFVKNFDIGVDIEKIKDDFDVLDIATNYFSELEIEALKNVPKEKQAEYFYRCWTRKESFIKAKGQGLSFPLDSFSVCINSDKKTELLETKWDEAEKNRWKLFTFSPHQDYMAAVSIQGDVKSIEYFNFNRKEFLDALRRGFR